MLGKSFARKLDAVSNSIPKANRDLNFYVTRRTTRRNMNLLPSSAFLMDNLIVSNPWKLIICCFVKRRKGNVYVQ